MSIVLQDRLESDLGNLDDAQMSVGTHHHSGVTVLTEHDWLTVAKVDHHLAASFASGDFVVGAFVEDVAVLQDLNERCAAVGVRRAKCLHHVLAIEVVSSSHKPSFGTERQRQRTERMVDGPHRCRLGHLA